MNIVFMGTPDFAVPCLEKLCDAGHNVCAVFTQPDKPVGRKQIMTPPDVKVAAQKLGIPVYQPERIKNSDALEVIQQLKPDVIVVVAYGKILPKEILNAARYGCINVHASILPNYRGAAPIQWAVINGDEETGVTIMQMDEGLDTGDIIHIEKTKISINETSAQLFDRLSVIGGDALVDTLVEIENGTAIHTKQPDIQTQYASMITKDMCPIDWTKSAFEIHNQIRGLQTWPVATTIINGKNVKIHKSVLSEKTGVNCGEVLDNNNTITVCCGDNNCIEILELQPEGKKKMDAKSYLLGNKVEIGSLLGGK